MISTFFGWTSLQKHSTKKRLNGTGYTFAHSTVRTTAYISIITVELELSPLPNMKQRGVNSQWYYRFGCPIALPHKLLQMLASCSVYLIRSEVKYCRPTTLSTSCFSTCMTCIWSSNPILLFQIKIQVLADVSIHNAWQCIATCVRGTLYAHFSDWKRDVSSAIVLWHALHSIMLTCAGMQVIFLTTPETSWQHRVVSA